MRFLHLFLQYFKSPKDAKTDVSQLPVHQSNFPGTSLVVEVTILQVKHILKSQIVNDNCLRMYIYISQNVYEPL